MAPASSVFGNVTNTCHMWFALSLICSLGEKLHVQESILHWALLFFFFFLLMYMPGCVQMRKVQAKEIHCAHEEKKIS